MFKSNFVDGIINIISNKFNINDDIPIKCFANKMNTIYGYVDNKWKILIFIRIFLGIFIYYF